MNSPLENNQNAHISKSAEKENLLWKPLKEEIDVIFEIKSV